MKLQVLDFPSEVNDGENQIKYPMQMFSGTGQQTAQGTILQKEETQGELHIHPRSLPGSANLGTQKHVHPK